MDRPRPAVRRSQSLNKSMQNDRPKLELYPREINLTDTDLSSKKHAIYSNNAVFIQHQDRSFVFSGSNADKVQRSNSERISAGQVTNNNVPIYDNNLLCGGCSAGNGFPPQRTSSLHQLEKNRFIADENDLYSFDNVKVHSRPPPVLPKPSYRRRLNENCVSAQTSTNHEFQSTVVFTLMLNRDLNGNQFSGNQKQTFSIQYRKIGFTFEQYRI